MPDEFNIIYPECSRPLYFDRTAVRLQTLHIHLKIPKVLRPKPNTFSYPYFITHTSLLFEFSIEKKYSRLAGKILEVRSTRIFPENAVETQGKYFSGGSTAFSGGLHIYYGNQIAEF